MMDSSKRIILVTGGNGGLGSAIAESFLRESEANHVVVAVRQNRSRAENLAAQYPNRSLILPLDVASADSWKAGVETVLKTFGRLDALVNNAGYHADGLLATMPQQAWSSVIDANLTSVFLGCQAALPAMIIQKSGRIINISSLSALLAPAGQANYSAAKAGVIALTQSLAKEVARIGITVNAICPGYIETEALAFLDADARKAAAQRIPMRRFGKPEEVAAAVRFLACAEAGYITGSILKIDGGIF
jgi:3-oxoacyl-[acyl-carrier protein] reductase